MFSIDFMQISIDFCNNMYITSAIITTISFVKCLDYNDYRYGDCRKEEKLFLESWNKAHATSTQP